MFYLAVSFLVLSCLRLACLFLSCLLVLFDPDVSCLAVLCVGLCWLRLSCLLFSCLVCCVLIPCIASVLDLPDLFFGCFVLLTSVIFSVLNFPCLVSSYLVSAFLDLPVFVLRWLTVLIPDVFCLVSRGMRSRPVFVSGMRRDVLMVYWTNQKVPLIWWYFSDFLFVLNAERLSIIYISLLMVLNSS